MGFVNDINLAIFLKYLPDRSCQ